MGREIRETGAGMAIGEAEPGALRNFSVRLPADLYRELAALRGRTGESMNKLIGDAVAAFVDRPDLALTSAPSDINARIAQDAVRQNTNAIGPIIGIANHASNRGQTALASVLYAAAARLIREKDGPETASIELVRSAKAAEQSRYFELAVALYEEALQLNPNNLEASNRLGQRLHHLAASHGDDIERYRRAADQLARVTFVDNHAKLFHGWSALYVARAEGDPYAEERAVAEIEEALKHWAFSQRADDQRRSWLRQVQRLVRAGLGVRAEALIEFANSNARWSPIEPADLAPSSEPADSAIEPSE
jgi:tetratricopeptide (TPR) repeat protein